MADRLENPTRDPELEEEEPVGDDGLEADGIADLKGPLPSKVATGDPQEGVVPPGDRPRGADEFGTTAAEQLRGEPAEENAVRIVPEGQVPGAYEASDDGYVRRGLLDGGAIADTVDTAKAALASPHGRQARAILAAGVIVTAPLVMGLPVIRKHPLGRLLALAGGAAFVVRTAEAIRDWEPDVRAA
jgi:hypothetical protein